MRPQYGKGDLILSLLGYAPEQDHTRLWRVTGISAGFPY